MQGVIALDPTQIGNSDGVVLPEEVPARLKLEKGGTVFVTNATDGIELTPYSPAFEDQMAAARGNHEEAARRAA